MRAVHPFSRRLTPLAAVAAAGALVFSFPAGNTAQAQESGNRDAATARRPRRSLVNEADAAALAAFRLTPQRLDQFEATLRRTVEAMRRNPALREQARAAQAGGGARPVDAVAAQLEREHPDYAALIRSAGWSVRESLLTTYALLAGATFSGLGNNARPPAYLSPENLAFVRANLARVQAAFRLYEQEDARMSAGGGERR